MTTDFTQDHKTLEDAQATRRYFAKFERIIRHLTQVAKLSQKEQLISEAEANILEAYLVRMSNTFTALSYKYLMANRAPGQNDHLLSMDKKDSGFPVFQELLQMAADAQQAETHLKSMPSEDRLRKEMVTHILNEKQTPSRLQFSLSQRIYYEHLRRGELFWSRNDPHAYWAGSQMDGVRRNYLMHWAIYDSQTNVPAIYLMELEDSGDKALPRDERRWPEVQNHLMAQSVSALKLLTIAKGFDTDFDDLHPKTLRRFHVGPMYSHAFTEQAGPLRDVLAEAQGETGQDWALAWTVETLVSMDTFEEKTGWFSSAERQIYKIDQLSPQSIDQGATEVRQSLIIPHRAYQVLEEKDPPSLRNARKYVVGSNSRVLSY